MSVPSLRSLSLMRVHDMGLPSSTFQGEGIPATLVKDLAKAKLFSGNFVEDNHDYFETSIQQTALTIRYDGTYWTFSSRSRSCVLDCCYNCDFVRPDLMTVTLQENVSSPFFSPFSRTDVCVQEQTQQNPPDITLNVQMEKDGSEGLLTFRGNDGGGVKFTSVLKVLTTDGLHLLHHKADITNREGRSFHLLDYLDDGDYKEIMTAEMAFPELLQNLICMNQEISDFESWWSQEDEHYDVFWDDVGDHYNSSWGGDEDEDAEDDDEEWEWDGGLTEFWASLDM